MVSKLFLGYANLGIGAYLVNHSAPGEPAELVISLASDAEKQDREIGDSLENLPGTMIHPEDMVVRIRFSTVRGLEVLENHLRLLREVHFQAGE